MDIQRRNPWFPNVWSGPIITVQMSYELLAVPPKRKFPSEPLRWFDLNNSLRHKDVHEKGNIREKSV